MSILLNGKAGEKALLMGNEALVRGAVEAGLDFACSYPGTPSSEASSLLFALQKDAGFAMEFATNEKVALEAAAGAALGGLWSMTAMKHVGLNVAADPLGTLACMGVRGALVLYNADDPGMFSSQNEQDNRHYAQLFSVPMLEPADAQDMLDMTRAAFALSHELAMPVMVRATTRVAHMRGVVRLGEIRPPHAPAPFIRSPRDLVTLPVNAKKMHERLLERMEKAGRVSEESPFNRVLGRGRLGIVASGVSIGYVFDVLEELDLRDEARLFCLGMSWPLPERKLADFLGACERVLVVEELEPWLETHLRAIAQRAGLSVSVSGKGGPLSRLSEYDPALVREAVAAFFGVEPRLPRMVDLADLPPLTPRPPSLCPGCPHRMTYYAAKKAAEGLDVIFPNDIGCYTLGFMPPFGLADMAMCMGASVSAPAGLEHAGRGTAQKILAFIGDSTFFHSGMTGLAHAVFNNHKFTLVILDNQITAMTGHQPSPSMDAAAAGHALSPLDLEAVVRGLGVRHVQTVRPANLKKTTEAIREALLYDGLSVIIAREPCPLAMRRQGSQKKKPVFSVNQEICKKCTTCIRTFSCPAFVQDADGVRIDPALCTGCAVCVQVCPHGSVRPLKASPGAARRKGNTP